jgi:hypothetical protein
VYSPAHYPLAQAHSADLYRRAQANQRHNATRTASRRRTASPANSLSTRIAQAIGRPATA